MVPFSHGKLMSTLTPIEKCLELFDTRYDLFSLTSIHGIILYLPQA
jgi:hypothetical protein